MTKEAFLEDLLNRKEYTIIGKRVTRVDTLDKVHGTAKFAADHLVQGMLYAKVVRSTQPHAIIRRISTADALETPGVRAVITAMDIPGENQIGYAVPDQPLLNGTKVHYIGDPIAIVCADDEYAAERGMDAVRVDYETLPPLFTPEEALRRDAPSIHEKGNIAATTRIRKGDVEKGFADAEVEVEHVYTTPYQDHACLETETALAMPTELGIIELIGAMQSPFLVRDFVSQVLKRDVNKVRVIQAYTGGAFGREDDMGPIVCAWAALSAEVTRRPVMLAFDKDESIIASPKRCPYEIRYKSGAKKDGRLLAAEVDITMDAGAYADRAPFILWRSTVHAGGPYVVPNVKVDGRAVYTNKAYEGSFRGFGNPEIHFAIESQMDELAEKLGMDPAEFRLLNVLRSGSRTTCDQLLDHSVGIEECLRKSIELADWKRKRETYGQSKGKIRTGIGVGCGYHGISISRGAPDWSAASVIINIDGSITYQTGICELGQGTLTGHAKIVAEILGVPMSFIHVERPDTSSAPDSHPTHGSRGLMMGGSAAADAALRLRSRLDKLAGEILECSEQDLDFRDGRVLAKSDSSKSISFAALAKELYVKGVKPSEYGFFRAPRRFFSPASGLGVAYGVYTFVVNIAEVEVDVETGFVNVVRVYSAADVGKAIDLDMIGQQIQGGIIMGMGYALMEGVTIEKGVTLNPNYADYVIPTAKDIPDLIEPIIVEHPYSGSAFGAKGIGEPSIITTPAAIANAIYHATGTRFLGLPITPEKLYLNLRKTREEKRK